MNTINTIPETLKMTNIERDDCIEKCAFARAVTALSNEIKHCVKYPVFTWILSGAGGVIITLILLLFGQIGSMNDKLDMVNTNINTLKVEVVERVTKVETTIDIEKYYNNLNKK